MKMKIRLLFFLYLLFEKSFGCEKEVVENYGIILRCGNISSLQDIPNLGEEEVRLQMLIVLDGSMPTLASSQLSKHPHVNHLEFNNNGIKEIEPGAFSGLKTLRSMYIIYNQLTELIPGIFNSLSNLAILSFFKNRIVSINKFAFSGLINLRTLHLGHNRLTKIESDIFKFLPKMDRLDLDGNPLQDFAAPLSLTYLDISKCGLKRSDLPLSLPNLRILLMNGNQIRVLEKPFFGQSEELDHIDLSHNNISSISKDYFVGFQSLRYLLLNHNNIVAINSNLFQDLVNLMVLDISFNQIERIPYGTFVKLKNLRKLNISDNHLKVLPESTIYPMAELEDLNFQNNEISVFNAEEFLSKMKKLKSVWLNHNPWNCAELVKMQDRFKRNNVTLANSTSFDVENFKGITCKSEVRKAAVTSCENADMLNRLKKFLNQDYKKTGFFQYFEDYKASKKFMCKCGSKP